MDILMKSGRPPFFICFLLFLFKEEVVLLLRRYILSTGGNIDIVVWLSNEILHIIRSCVRRFTRTYHPFVLDFRNLISTLSFINALSEEVPLELLGSSVNGYGYFFEILKKGLLGFFIRYAHPILPTLI